MPLKSITLKNFEIINIVEEIGGRNLTPTSHLYSYKNFAGKKIIEAAQQIIGEYTQTAKECPPLTIIDVVLAANRDYNNMVRDVIVSLKKETSLPFIRDKTFDSLLTYLKEHFREFYSKYITKKQKFEKGVKAQDIFSKDEKDVIENKLFFREVNHFKMKMLFDILEAIEKLKEKNPELSNGKTDFEFLSWWAIEYCKKFYNNDILIPSELGKEGLGYKIENVAAATLQHLRMNFGADTIKPDQRVKEVLLYKFLGLYEKEFTSGQLKNEKVFSMIEKIYNACEKKYTRLSLDSMFVNYGSGYYRRNNDTAAIVDGIISAFILKLKEKGVDEGIIEYATGYGREDIKKLISNYKIAN